MQHNLGTVYQIPGSTCAGLLPCAKNTFPIYTDYVPACKIHLRTNTSLARLDATQALLAITKPADAVGIRYEKDVAEKIVSDLQSEESEHLFQITPPHLQIVCSTLVETLPSHESVITEEQYVNLGGADTILQNQLQRVLKGRLAAHYSQSILLLHSLVTSARQRVQCNEAQLLRDLAEYDVDEFTLNTILVELESSRILRKERSEQIYVYELAHDYLIDEIEFNPEILAQKAAKELLEQEYRNWTEFRAFLQPEILQVLTAQRHHFKHLDDLRQQFILSSSLINGVDVEAWLPITPLPVVQQVLVDLLDHDDWQVRLRAIQQLTNFFCDAAQLPLARTDSNRSSQRRAQCCVWRR